MASGHAARTRGVVGGITACWYLLFTHLVGRGRSLISKPAVQRGLAVVTGCVLLPLGAVVASGG